jgi:hypothetical protein
MVFSRRLFGGISNAVGGALGGLGQQPQTPMGGLERPQVSYFGDNMLSNMGNNTRLGNNSQLGQLGNMVNMVQPAIGMPGGVENNYRGIAGLVNPTIDSYGGQLTPLPSPNMPQPYMPGIDPYGGQLTPLPSPNMPQPNMGRIAGGVENNYRGIAGLVNPFARMPGIDSYGGQLTPLPSPNMPDRMPGIDSYGGQLTPLPSPNMPDRMPGIDPYGGQLTPLPSPNMPQPYMPGIDGGMRSGLTGLLNTMPNQPPAGLAGLLGAVPTAPTAPTVSMAARPLSAMPRLPAKAPALRQSMVRAAPKRAIKKLIKKR